MTLPCTSGRRRGAIGVALVGLLSPLALTVPAWASSVANEVVFTADSDDDGLYTVVLRNLETQQSTTLLPEDAANEWTYDDPELSPDGSRVVLSTDRGSATGQEGIAVVSRDGSGFRRLTEPPRTATSESVDLASSWSPSGDRVLFTRITAPLGSRDPAAVRTALHVVPAAGGAAVPYGQATDGYTADWSPDGTRIVFAALPTGADSGPLTVISSDPASTAGRTSLGVTGLMPAWSPDGSTIAYATITARDADRARAQDTALLATVPAGGGAQRLLSVTRPDPSRPSVAEYPAWSPDGQSIVYDLFSYATGADLPPGDLWAVDRAGVRAGRLLRTPGDETQPHLQGPAPSAVSAGAPSEYVPVTPRRVLDTRPGPGTVGAPAARVGAGGTVDLRVHGLTTEQGAIPTSATAVVLNVTAVDPSTTTDVRVYPTPADGAVPRSSNLNSGPGQVVPNLVTATLGSGGSVRLRNAAGSVHLIADVAGYYLPAGAGGSGFTAVDPGRVLDTRPNGVGAPAASVGPGGTLDLQVTGSLPTSDGRTVSVPADARAVVLNVTATGVTANTDVRVFPTPASGTAIPTVSNLNVGPGQTAANLVTVPVGAAGKVRLRNAQGRVQLLADIAGYYSAGSTGRFVPVAPTRFLDTRSGVGAAPIATTAAGFVDLQVGGSRGVPAGATAAVLNVTGTGVSTTTNVRAYPSTAGTLPTVSNLNLGRGETRANLTVVKVGSDGRVRVRNAAGEVQLISDLAGYFVG